MQHHSFHVGDRVVTNKPLSGIPAGTAGTIIRVYISVPGCYDVKLNGFPTSRLMYEADLNRVSGMGNDDEMR